MFLYAAFLLCVLSYSSASIESNSEINKYLTFVEEECIPYTVYPATYDLTITPYIYLNRKWQYKVEMIITVFTLTKGVKVIELDAKDIPIEAKNIRVLHNNLNVLESFSIDKEKLYLNLNSEMIPYVKYKNEEKYMIEVTFTKFVNFASEGILFLPYENEGTKYLFATRLSPKQAHYFIPCFNNPKFESVFTFKVREPQTVLQVQYANTSLVVSKELWRENQRDYVIVHYLPSQQIAPYQVGFHYSNFGSSSKVTAKSTTDVIVIWAYAKNLHNYDYMLNFSERMLNMIIEYSTCFKQFPYRPLMDGPINIVAVPKVRDLDGYEIGSWNLLTNSEFRLYYSQDFTSIEQQEKMTYDLTLQLCRIWLGNPGEKGRTRWQEEWFKEGVATYFAHFFMTQHQQTFWSLEHQEPLREYGLRMKYKSMFSDWGKTAITLKNLETTPAVEITDLELVQLKAASLLWMIENWVGSEKFHRAFLKYINSRRGRTISLVDFTNFLDKETVDCLEKFTKGITATKILDSWLSYGGYPVITVNVLRADNTNTLDIIQLKQHKFSFTKPVDGDSPCLVEITYKKQNSTNCFNCAMPKYTIESEGTTFKDNLNGGWIILNVNASAYYRVNYDWNTWLLISKALMEERDSIPEENRAQILNDVFALYAAGQLNLDLALHILAYLDRETSPLVWESAIHGFEYLKISGANCNMTKHLYKNWQNFMSKKVNRIHAQMGLKEDQHTSIRIFRQKVVSFACAVDHQRCIHIMNQCNTKPKVDPDTRVTCYEVNCKNNLSFCTQGSFNKWEVEDKIIAESKIKNEKVFKSTLPRGTPVSDFPEYPPSEIRELTTPIPFVHTTDDVPGAGTCLTPSTTAIICTFVISVLRFKISRVIFFLI